MNKIFTAFLEYQREGSNWALDKVLGVNLHIGKNKPLKGFSFIPLQAKLANWKAIVNERPEHGPEMVHVVGFGSIASHTETT